MPMLSPRNTKRIQLTKTHRTQGSQNESQCIKQRKGKQLGEQFLYLDKIDVKLKLE